MIYCTIPIQPPYPTSPPTFQKIYITPIVLFDYDMIKILIQSYIYVENTDYMHDSCDSRMFTQLCWSNIKDMKRGFQVMYFEITSSL